MVPHMASWTAEETVLVAAGAGDAAELKVVVVVVALVVVVVRFPERGLALACTWFSYMACGYFQTGLALWLSPTDTRNFMQWS